MKYLKPRFLNQGEGALVVEFGDEVDPAINARVISLDTILRELALPGLRETTPSFRSLLVYYEPLDINRRDLIKKIEEIIDSQKIISTPSERRCLTIPCCYDPMLAEDINEAAARLNISSQTLANTHVSVTYQAYMYGFSPGWCYLGGTAPALSLPRRNTPRSPTPTGAILIAAGLSLIATNPMPTGWYVIGRTPERLFLLNRNPPFLISPGDNIKFEAIDAVTFADLEARATLGEIVTQVTTTQ